MGLFFPSLLTIVIGGWMNRGTWDEVDFVTHTSGVDSNDQPAQTGRKDIYPPLSPTLKPFRARCTD